MDRTPCFNTLAANQHLDAQDRADAAAHAEYREAKAAVFESFDRYDVAETLCCDAMVEAIKTRNADLIGRVALHLMDAYAHGAALLTAFDAERDYRKDEAAALAMVDAFKGAKQ